MDAFGHDEEKSTLFFEVVYFGGVDGFEDVFLGVLAEEEVEGVDDDDVAGFNIFDVV